jgi:hypothetical protein
MRALSSGLSTEAGGAVSAVSGAAINPHTTLLFNGVMLKNFTFDWTLSPRDESEANNLSKIIKTIKSKSLPSYKGVGGAAGGSSFSRGLLEYPDLVRVYFTGYDPNHIFQFKESMISNVTVNYSAGGGNVMHKGSGGSAPAFVQLSLGFTEAEIWTRDDYQ